VRLCAVVRCVVALAAGFFVSAEAHRLFWLIVFLSAALVPLAAAATPSASPSAPPADTLATPTAPR